MCTLKMVPCALQDARGTLVAVQGFSGTVDTMRKFLPSAMACLAAAALAGNSPAASADVPVYDQSGTYAWVLPPVGFSNEDYPVGVRFPMTPASGFAGVLYAIFNVSTTGVGDGRVWDGASTPNITNAIPVFCVEEGTDVAYNQYYTSPGKTTLMTRGGFAAGDTVTATGPDVVGSTDIADSAGVAEVFVTLSASAVIGTQSTVTFSNGTISLTATITAADPYLVNDWTASRALVPANLGVATWIATHADQYTDAGVLQPTLSGGTDHVTGTAMAAVTQVSDKAGVEGAAAQLAIWQALAGKKVTGMTPEANSPMANYQAASPHATTSQTRASGGAFPATPNAASLDTTVLLRAIELFTAATTDGTPGNSDDNVVAEPWRAPKISVSVGASTDTAAVVTVTGTRTSSSGALSEALSGAVVTLTGADFDAVTPGVQAGTVTLNTSGTATATAVTTTAAQNITAAATTAVPPGTLLSVAPHGATPSTLQLQQLITAKAVATNLTASGVVAAATAAPTTTVAPTTTAPTTTAPTTTVAPTTTAAGATTVPGDTSVTTIADPGTSSGTTRPKDLPFSGPMTTLTAILFSGAAGLFGVLLRRRTIR